MKAVVRDWAFWAFLGLSALTVAFSGVIAGQLVSSIHHVRQLEADVRWMREEMEVVKRQNQRSIEDRQKLHQQVESIKDVRP
jgi:uncharacterized protein (DUF3084 family)